MDLRDLQFVYFNLKYALPVVIKILFLTIVDDAVSVCYGVSQMLLSLCDDAHFCGTPV